MLGSSKKDAPETPASETPKPATGASAGESKTNALLGKGSEFEGKLSFEGTVKIDGVMKGEIRSKDNLVIGEGAKVEAEIEVGSAVVSGQVNGNVTAKNRVELKSPARITGNITTPVLIIEEGVVLDGNCSMSGDKGGASSGTAASTSSAASSSPGSSSGGSTGEKPSQ